MLGTAAAASVPGTGVVSGTDGGAVESTDVGALTVGTVGVSSTVAGTALSGMNDGVGAIAVSRSGSLSSVAAVSEPIAGSMAANPAVAATVMPQRA